MFELVGHLRAFESRRMAASVRSPHLLSFLYCAFDQLQGAYVSTALDKHIAMYHWAILQLQASGEGPNTGWRHSAEVQQRHWHMDCEGIVLPASS